MYKPNRVSSRLTVLGQPSQLRVFEIVIAREDKIALHAGGGDKLFQQRRGKLHGASTGTVCDYLPGPAAIVIQETVW